jgi:hypothetical protein
MMTLRRHWLLTLLAVASCSKKIESPKPSLASFSPVVVCNAMPSDRDRTVVALSGAGLTPMPSRTLRGARGVHLILPRIDLTRTFGLDDAAVAPQVVTVPDDPVTGLVSWQSEQAMSFAVTPGLGVPEGFFSITVTNPDGVSQASAGFLTVLPPPIVSALRPTAICNDQSAQTVEIDGAFFARINGTLPSVRIGTQTFTPTQARDCRALQHSATPVELCTGLTIVIPAGTFQVTEDTQFPLVVTNPAPANCFSSQPITLTVRPPPRVDTVQPATVCTGGSVVTVRGAHFQQNAAVDLRCGAAGTVRASFVTVAANGQTITATFGPGAPAGETCDVVVVNPDGCEDRPLPHKTVTVTTGPVLFLVDPEVVYNGIRTRITLFATTIRRPLPSNTVVIVPASQTAPQTQLSFNEVPGHPNRLQAIVSMEQAPGTYDVVLTDDSGCFARLPGGLVVTAQLTTHIREVVPRFGWTMRDTAVTLFRDTAAPAPNQPWLLTPRAFLNPSNPGPTDIAVEVQSAALVDQNTVTGVVPQGTPARGYDVILVNPDGAVALLTSGFDELADPPPTIDTATPASIVAAAGQDVVLRGESFAAGATASLRCADVIGNLVATPPPVLSQAPVCVSGACSMMITVDASALPLGSVCVARITNPDGAFGEFSAIGVTNPSLNLSQPRRGTDMTVGRRAPSAAAGNATPAARFVYAMGGDTGQTSGALDSVEAAPVDLFGRMGAFQVQPYRLRAPRTLAGTATVGRYIYLIGGDDGEGPVNTAERALILSPRETPVVVDLDVVLGATGLETGTWRYRVSAVFDASDSDNPGGESLPSDPFTIKLPDFSATGKKVAVTLIWRAPVDRLGQAVPGVAGYRIYRTPTANAPLGTEALLASVTGAATLTFTDNGTTTPARDAPKPLALGSTGAWAALPNLGTARAGLAVATGRDPVEANRFYVYALLGRVDASTATGSYELLPVTVAANGRQTIAAASWTAGSQSSSQPRWQIGAWVVDATVTANVTAPDTFVFVGGGLTAGGAAADRVEVGKIAQGGDLGQLANTPKDFTANAAGYGVTAANEQLFLFGGGSGMPSTGARSALLDPFPDLANNAWNNEGLQMTHGRYLLGSAVQSAFIFLLGGQTDEPSAASRTTELVIW